MDANDASVAFDKGDRVFRVSEFDQDMGGATKPQEIKSVSQFTDGNGEGTYFILKNEPKPLSIPKGNIPHGSLEKMASDSGKAVGEVQKELVEKGYVPVKNGLTGEILYKKSGGMKDKAGLFGGESAKDAPPKGYVGWFKGKDGKMRFEIDDSVSKIKSGAEIVKGRVKLGDVLNHRELYDQYPQLKDVDVIFTPRLKGTNGEFDPKNSTISLSVDEFVNPKTKKLWGAGSAGTHESLQDILLHEIQHAIQKEEGFARGGSVATFTQQEDAKIARDALLWAREINDMIEKYPKMDLSAIENKIVAEYQRMDVMDWLPSRISRDLGGQPDVLNKKAQYDDLQEIVKAYGLDENPSPMTAKEGYKRLAGEVEARNVQDRMKLTKEERLAKSPESTEDVDRLAQIVVKQKGTMESITLPGKEEQSLIKQPKSPLAGLAKPAPQTLKGGMMSRGGYAKLPDVIKEGLQHLPKTASNEYDLYKKALKDGTFSKAYPKPPENSGMSPREYHLVKKGIFPIWRGGDVNEGGIKNFFAGSSDGALGYAKFSDADLNLGILKAENPVYVTPEMEKAYGVGPKQKPNYENMMKMFDDLQKKGHDLVIRDSTSAGGNSGYEMKEYVPLKGSKFMKLKKWSPEEYDSEGWDPIGKMSEEEYVAKVAIPEGLSKSGLSGPPSSPADELSSLFKKTKNMETFVKSEKFRNFERMADEMVESLPGNMSEMNPQQAKTFRQWNALKSKIRDVYSAEYEMRSKNREMSRDLRADGTEGDLVALHNLGMDKIKKIRELGGLPGPSIGITKKSIPFDDFGGITLVGDRKLVESVGASTYDADIYSPRVPSHTLVDKPEYRMNEARKNLENRLAQAQKKYPWHKSSIWDVAQGARESDMRNLGAQLLFASENGIKVEPVRSIPQGQNFFNKAVIAKNLKAEKIAKYLPEKIPQDNEEFTSMMLELSKKIIKENGLEENALNYKKYDGFGFGDADRMYSYMNGLKKAVEEGIPVDVYDTTRNISDQFVEKGLKDKFQEFYAEIADQFYDKKLFKGFTNSGGRKFEDYNMDNVIREMFKSGMKGTESNMFSGGLSQTLGKNANKLGLEGIRKMKFDKLDSEYTRLKERWSSIVGWNNKEAIEVEFNPSKSAEWNADRIGNGFTEEDAQELLDIYKEARKLPKSYIETKFKRAVNLSEFKAVIAPKGIVKELKELLKGTGLEDRIVSYDPVTESRNSKLDSVRKKFGSIFFSQGGALIPAAYVMNEAMKQGNQGESR